jgi:hypothetical protein
MNTSATGEGGDCYGDSGGPKFLAGNTSMIVGPCSWGDTPCRSLSKNYRLDTASARTFLSRFVRCRKLRPTGGRLMRVPRSSAVMAAAIAAVLLFVSADAPALVARQDAKFDQMAALVQQKMSEYGVPGVGFAVLKNGQLTARGFGVTNVDNPQPITPDTIFALASISKTVTTTAMMRLVEQGRSISTRP